MLRAGHLDGLGARDSDEESKLVADLQLGVPAAWALLYDVYFPKLQRLALFRLGSRYEAEDVAAITFQRAVEKIGTYSYRRTSIGSWLYKIADNVVRERLRKVSRYLPEGQIPGGMGNLQSSGNRYASTEANDPARAIDLRLDVQAGLQKLTREQREVVNLVCIAGFSVREAAEVLGKSERSVYYVQARGLLRLRSLLS